jgi:predicted metal-dependent hydrolase
MRQVIILILTLVSLIVIGYYLWVESQFQSFEISNNYFKVEKNREVESKNRSLQMLVEVRDRLDKLVTHMLKKMPDNEYVIRMKDRFEGTVLKEANYDINNPHQSSYTINKGDTMVLCLRSKDNSMVDMNTLMYVAIHELAHIYSSSQNHTEEFWNNMRLLINEAKGIGIYHEVDYAKNPVEYCGMDIRSSGP